MPPVTENELSLDRPSLDRRSLLVAGAAAGAVGAGALALGAGTASAAARDNRHFAHGVASGDPHPDSVILWTRVTPTPAATPGSGKGPDALVRWQVSRSRDFGRVVAQGKARTGAARDHTVKVEATGLEPGTTYFYRFSYDGVHSRTGRTRTAPAPHASPDNLRFGIVSCANLQAGWFSAYRHLARRDDLDAVIHLGDYLYEYAPGEYGYGQANKDIRPHQPPREMVSLADYRQRHAQYKHDPDLQDLHAKYAVIATWDDHEVANDQWKKGAENHQPDEGDYLARRRRAHRAYDEWMPVRMGGTTETGDGTRLFRRLRFGRLAELSMLDLRSYRDKQVELAATPAPSPDPAISDPDRTITGDRQMAWLKDSLARDAAQWKLVGNPVMIAPVVFPPLRARADRPDQRRHRAAARGRDALQRRPVGRLHRRPARAVRVPRRPRHHRHGVPHRRHPLRVGLRPPDRRRHLPGQPRRSPRSSSAPPSPATTSRTSPARRRVRRAWPSRRRSRPPTGTSSTSTSTTTASRSSTSRAGGRRWTTS